MRKDILKHVEQDFKNIEDFINILAAYGTDKQIDIKTTDDEIKALVLEMANKMKTMIAFYYAAKIVCMKSKKFKRDWLDFQREIVKGVIGVDLEDAE